jgi:glycosyltransferase involved in cell wall biosynthesis
MFGRWAAQELGRETWDVIHTWSGVSEEILQSRPGSALTLLMRGSAHVKVQSRLLIEEEARSGVPLDRPSAWMVERELREYALADQVLVLSTFSKQSFQAEGFPPQKLSLVRLGVDVSAFRPDRGAIAARKQRIRSGEPLRVLYVGSVSYQKGLLDLERVIGARHGRGFRFRLVGQVLPEAAAVVARLKGKAEIVGKLPQASLPAEYRGADLFFYPTIQDGYPMVMAQAKAAGLPTLTTPHGAGSDIISSGVDGWIVPARDTNAMIDRLDWCNTNREAIASMVDAVYDLFKPRGWAVVAEEFERVCAEHVGAAQRGGSRA